MLSKTAVVAAGVCGTLFIGYCIYFDRKRRTDPKFKEILRDRRAKALMQKKQAEGSSKIQLPNLRDYEAVQKFFIQEVQLGEELLSQGDLENGIEHLSTAVAICGEPAHLVEVLEQQLAPHVFAMLMQRLPVISRRVVNMSARRMQEEDVE